MAPLTAPSTLPQYIADGLPKQDDLLWQVQALRSPRWRSNQKCG